MRAAVTPSLLILLFSLLPLVALAASTAGVRRSAIAGVVVPRFAVARRGRGDADAARRGGRVARRRPAGRSRWSSRTPGGRYSGPVAAAAFRTVQRGDVRAGRRRGAVAPRRLQRLRARRRDGLPDAARGRPARPRGDVDALETAAWRARSPGAENEPSTPSRSSCRSCRRRSGASPSSRSSSAAPTRRRTAFAERSSAKLDDGKTLFVFSTDFTHYGPRFGYAPFGPLGPGGAREDPGARQDTAVASLAKLDAEGFRRHLGRRTRRSAAGTACDDAGAPAQDRSEGAGDAPRRTGPRARCPGCRTTARSSYVAMAFYDPPETAPKGRGAPGDAADGPADRPAARAEALGRALVRLARAAIDLRAARHRRRRRGAGRAAAAAGAATGCRASS